MSRRVSLRGFVPAPRRGKAHQRRNSLIGSSYARRLRVEALEDRRLLAITVDTPSDVVDANDSVTSLREAIATANSTAEDTINFAVALSGETILLAAGELAITDALTIDATALAEPVTIDAQLQSRIFNIDDPTTTDEAFGVTLAGLTLTRGKITGDNTDALDNTFSGGAIRSASSGYLTLDRMTVSDSLTEGVHTTGGGVNAQRVTLFQSTISGNQAKGSFSGGLGGGIIAIYATLTQSTVSGNHIEGYLGGSGGGINARFLTLTDSTVSGNSSKVNYGSVGGGIVAFEATLTRSTVSENYTEGLEASAGGIFAQRVTITQSTVSGNYTEGERARGGGIVSDLLTLTQSTVSGNHTEGSSAIGGGIFATGAATLTGSTISGNYSLGTGANGGGIHASSLSVQNTIIANNTVAEGSMSPDLRTGLTTIPDIDFSLIGDTAGSGIDASTGTGNLLDVDPLLGPLADNGGPTQTHALSLDSPAINTGDFTAMAGVDDVPLFDQRGAGFDRVVDLLDMGAYEEQTFVFSPFVVTTVEDEFDFSNRDVSLREAIHIANLHPDDNTITFEASLAGESLLLTDGELAITDALSINATALDIPVTIDAQQQSRIFNINDGDFSNSFSVTLSGLTLTGGNPVGNSGEDHTGGAISNRENLTITNSAITANEVELSGGGIYHDSIDGTLNIVNSVLSGNSASRGGGIYSKQGTINVTRSILSENTAGRGGGIAVGQLNVFHDVTITDSTLTRNTAGGGGGIFFQGGDRLTVINSTLSENTAVEGGGIFNHNSFVILSNSTLSGNRASGLLPNTTEEVGYGGGIYNYFASTFVFNSTLAENRAVSDGGGMHLFGSNIVRITNSILANSVSGGDLSGSNSGTLSGGANLIEDDRLLNSFLDSIQSDPLLGSLTDNGGPTKTHALLPGSPALDTGDPNFDPNDPDGFPQTDDALPFDQRGTPFQRVAQGTLTGVPLPRVDIGAYEAQSAPSADFDSDNDVDGADFLAWQRGFGKADAVRADGNSDDDTDVDASDLAAWQVSYGDTIVLPPLSAVRTGSQLPPVGDATLIDAAMAVDLLSARDEDVVPFVAATAFAGAAATSSNESTDIVPPASDADFVSITQPSSEEPGGDTPSWLADELLERVFG